ncbi:MAG: hypothetical protein KBS83_04755, partial [Lachnospiraceae bacterium]|nr:hypothetical protein [Candidatus Equihabitans merdae]
SHKIVTSKTVPNDSFIATDHAWERIQDPTKIVGTAKAILDDFLDEYEDIASIGLTGQMHGVVYVDPFGKCLSPLYTWQDGRGDLAKPDGMSFVDTIKSRCGIPAATGFGLVTHISLLENAQVPEGAKSLATIPDYLGMVLTGREMPLIHTSMAASLGFFDTEKMAFDSASLSLMGVDPAILPEVTEEIEVLGSYRGCSVTVALGDNQASFLGAASSPISSINVADSDEKASCHGEADSGIKAGTLLLNMGTGGQISMLSDHYFAAPGIEARPFLKGKYLLVGSSLCGGRAYAILEHFFRSYMKESVGSGLCQGAGDESLQYEVMERLAEKALERRRSISHAAKQVADSSDQATSGLLREDKSDESFKVTTTFSGTRTNPLQRGSIMGISEDNFTPENMVYGVLEGMAQELYDLYQIIHEGTGLKPSVIMASGKGIRKNKVLQEIFRDMFGAELHLTEHEEEAAIGVAQSARCG